MSDSDTSDGVDRGDDDCPECGGLLTKKAIGVDGNTVAAKVEWLYCLDCGWDNRSGKTNQEKESAA